MAYYNPYMDVSLNDGTPKSSILIGFSIINHPFWGTPIFGNPHINGWYDSSPNRPPQPAGISMSITALGSIT